MGTTSVYFDPRVGGECPAGCAVGFINGTQRCPTCLGAGRVGVRRRCEGCASCDPVMHTFSRGKLPYVCSGTGTIDAEPEIELRSCVGGWQWRHSGDREFSDPFDTPEAAALAARCAWLGNEVNNDIKWGWCFKFNGDDTLWSGYESADLAIAAAIDAKEKTE